MIGASETWANATMTREKALFRFGKHPRVGLVAFITAVVATFIVGAVIAGILIAGIVGTFVIVTDVFVALAGSVFHAVVIGKGDFFVAVFLGSYFFLLGIRHLERFIFGVRFFRTDFLLRHRF